MSGMIHQVWLVVWNISYFSIHWEESSQLTFIFFRGVETTNQIHRLSIDYPYINHIYIYINYIITRSSHSIGFLGDETGNL